MQILFSIIPKVLICYAIMSFIFSFYFLVINYKGFNEQFKEDDRKFARLIMITMGPLLIIAAIVIWIVTSVLNKTIWRDNTKKVVEETISVSLSKILKNYNEYFEKN